MQNEDVFGSRINVQEFRSTKLNADDVDLAPSFTFDRIKKPSLSDLLKYQSPPSSSSVVSKTDASSNVNIIDKVSTNNKVSFTKKSSMKLNHIKNHSSSTTTMNFRDYRSTTTNNSSSAYYGGFSTGGLNRSNFNSSSSTYQQNSITTTSKNSSSKRNLMTDKLKQALGFQPKFNSTPTPPPYCFNEESAGGGDLQFDSSVDLTPIKLKVKLFFVFSLFLTGFLKKVGYIFFVLKQSSASKYVGNYYGKEIFNNNSLLTSTPVDVRVENLDTTMPIRCLKQNLYFVFAAVVRVSEITYREHLKNRTSY